MDKDRVKGIAVSRNDEKCTEVRMQSIGLQWPARKKRSDLG